MFEFNIAAVRARLPLSHSGRIRYHAHIPEPPGHDPDKPPDIPPPRRPEEDIDLPPREEPPPVRDPEQPRPM